MRQKVDKIFKKKKSEKVKNNELAPIKASYSLYDDEDDYYYYRYGW